MSSWPHSIKIHASKRSRGLWCEFVQVLRQGGQATLDKNGNPVQSVDYRQSGVILTVTPDIHESIIDLDISQELSSFVATTTGVNNSPTLLKRTVNSKLSIRSGEVVIFAGLNEQKSDQTQSRFLGFNIGKQSSQGDTEILVFVEAQRI